MALTVLSITPEDARNDVQIDSKIIVEFSGPVDPFTVPKGISVYCETANLWSGPDLAALDTEYRDVLDIGEDYAFYPVSYSITGNIVTITPQVSLIADKTHYVSILPGNDATRYISEPTTGTPVYLYQTNTNTAEINILSTYTGDVAGVLSITFTDTDKIDVVLDGNYLGEFIYAPNQEVNLGVLKISITSGFEINDVANISVIPAKGLASIYKNKFTTSKYTTTAPTSVRIEEKLKQESSAHSIKVVATIPHALSVNNDRCNPIVIKFSEPIDENQTFIDSIRIAKTSLVSGRIKAINYMVKASGDTIKIYLASVDNNGATEHVLNMDDVMERNPLLGITILE